MPSLVKVIDVEDFRFELTRADEFKVKQAGATLMQVNLNAPTALAVEALISEVRHLWAENDRLNQLVSPPLARHRLDKSLVTGQKGIQSPDRTYPNWEDEPSLTPHQIEERNREYFKKHKEGVPHE